MPPSTLATTDRRQRLDKRAGPGIVRWFTTAENGRVSHFVSLADRGWVTTACGLRLSMGSYGLTKHARLRECRKCRAGRGR